MNTPPGPELPLPDEAVREIHPTAIIERGAALGAGVRVGPYCCVGADVVLDDDVALEAHVVVAGRTRIGPRTQIFPFASIGHRPQDLKYRGEPSELVIGADNVIREHVTMNPGTAGGGMMTRIGERCLFMMGAHVAHDCQIDDDVIMVNNSALGGHVTIGEFAIIGGLAGVHQFVRVGKYAMVGGTSGVENDVIPYGSVMGNRAVLCGLNVIGLKRRAFAREAVHDLRAAYRLLFAEEGTLQERLQEVAELYSGSALVIDIVEFIRADSTRSICLPKSNRAT